MRTIPRAGLLAAGAVLGAVGVPALGSGSVLLLGAASAIGALLLGARRRTGMAALAAGLALLLLRAGAGDLIAPRPPAAGPIPTDERAWSATVTGIGSASGGRRRVDLLLADPAAPGGAGWRAWGWIPRDSLVAPGDRIAFRAAAEAAPRDGSELAAILATRGVVATVRIDEPPEIAGGGPLGELEHARRAGAAAIGRALPEPEAGLAAGILIGVRDGLDRTVAADFATTGLGHLVAISGWNIALVAGIAGALLLRLPLGRGRRTLIAIGAVSAYALASGASASVLRAAAMGGIALGAQAAGRPAGAATALGLATTALLAIDPASVADIGLQLSIGATVGILAWAEPIGGWIGERAGGRTPAWLATTLGVSLAAQAATLPLVLLHFGRVSLVAPLANLLAAPLVAPAMAVSAAGLGAGVAAGAGVPDALLAPVAIGGRLILGGLVAIAGSLAGWPLASVTLPSPLDLLAAGGAAVALAIVELRRRMGTLPAADRPAPVRTRGPARGAVGGGRPSLAAVGLVAGGAAALLAGTVGIAGGLRDGRISIHVLDVGQGDAVLVEGDRGTRILVDGGPDPDRLITLLDSRLPPWDRRIDLLILSHPHEDHAAGFPALFGRYRIGQVAENGMTGRGPGEAALRRVLAREGRPVARLAAGDRIAVDGGEIHVLWPPRDAVPARSPESGREVNDSSLVLDLRFGERRFLLAADVEDDVDPRLLAAGIAEGGRADLLKVAHHGSATATTDALLAALRPRVAVASAGRGNPYGHPSPRTLDRIRASGARVFRTDEDGSVSISSDGRDLRVVASGPTPVRSAAGGWDLRSTLLGPCRIPGGASLPPVTAGPFPARPAPWTTHPDRSGATPPLPCYDRRRDDPLPDGRRPDPPRPRGTRLARPAHGGRGGDRGRPRGACRRPRRPRGPPARGGGGPPPRHGQGAPHNGPAPCPRPRPRRRRVARAARARGALAGRRSPSRDPARHAGGGALAGECPAGGADRRLRGQARGGPPRSARCPVRPLGAAPSGPPRRPATRPHPGGAAGAGRLRRRRPRAGVGGAAPVGARRLPGGRGHPGAGGRPVIPATGAGSAPIAFLSGEDAWSIDRAVRELAVRLGADGPALEIWRAPGDEDPGEGDAVAARRTRVLEEVEGRVAGATLFGGGTLVVLRQPAWIARESTGRARLIRLLGLVAPGNGLCFTELAGTDGKEPAATAELRTAVAEAGGSVVRFPAIGRERFAPWLEERARELGTTLGPGAAALLAERVGANVRENDIDRRRQTELAYGELEKLALYRPGGTASREDVAALVAEAVPGSAWAFLDAVGDRRSVDASRLAERLLAEGTALPLLVAQLHRRLRDLIIARDLMDARARPPEIMKALGVAQPYRAQRLTEQAGTWTAAELEAALGALVALDLRSRGLDPAGGRVRVSDARDALGLQRFLGEQVARAARPAR